MQENAWELQGMLWESQDYSWSIICLQFLLFWALEIIMRSKVIESLLKPIKTIFKSKFPSFIKY